MKILRFLFYFGLWVGLTLTFFLAILFIRLPDVDELRDVRYQQPLQILTADGDLIARIGTIKRIPIAYEDIPPQLSQALISAEDARFFRHIGLDYRGLARAVLQMITHSDVQTGGSTITMQVARNYYLTRERTIIRKLNEILLALKIENRLSKEEILSLYVNKIFLGFQSYGMAAAAQTYYDKKLTELSLAQYAMLAALPKAPSGVNPVTNPIRAKNRRNWVLSRMTELGYISRKEYISTSKEPLTAAPYDSSTAIEANYLAETVRLALAENPLGYNLTKEDLYTAGYRVYTTIHKDMQQYANEAVRSGLLAYDLRHGWRGPESKFRLLVTPADFNERNPAYTDALKELAKISSYDNSLEPVIVREIQERNIIVITSRAENISLGWEDLKWAAPYISDAKIGKKPKTAWEIVSVGDVVRISPYGDKPGFRLAQAPKAEGAFIALNPRDGKVIALVGGYHFKRTQFNRAIQARRQIGSAIKPFIYSHALAVGWTGADIFKDAPLVSSAEGNFIWRPSNVGNTFLGYVPLRVGLYRSRNPVSIRLLRTIGISKTRSYMARFGLRKSSLPKDLSLALGSGEATPIEMVRAYSVFANGGYLITPHFIEHIEDANQRTIYVTEFQSASPLYEHDICNECINESHQPEEAPANPPILSPQTHYQIHSILKDVVKRGTGIRASTLGRQDLAGKTGTTQEFVDAWFVGYHPYLAAVSWVGFDRPSSLGPREYGGVAALPIWISFMKHALEKVPHVDFAQPDGLMEINITLDTEGNQFTEFIPNDRVEDFIKRAQQNTAFVDYSYHFPGDANETIPGFSLNITQETQKQEAIKELF